MRNKTNIQSYKFCKRDKPETQQLKCYISGEDLR